MSAGRVDQTSILRNTIFVFAAFALLILAALVVRLLTYDRYLPYMDFNEESNMYLLARHWRGVEVVPVIPEWLAGYPPLYVWVNMGVQSLVETLSTRPWVLPADYINALRLVSVTAGVVTTTLIVSIGWQMAGAVAGWFAGLVWALSPIIVEHNNIALSDPLIYLFTALTIAAALRASKTGRGGWLLVSLAGVILGIYTKYSVIYLLIPWGFANLLLVRRSFRSALPWLVAQAVIAAAAAFYLIEVYGAFGLNNMEAEQIRESGLQVVLSGSPVWNNLYYAILPIGMPIFLSGIAAGLAAYVYCARTQRQRVDQGWIIVLAVEAIFGVVLSAAFRTVDEDTLKMRHTLPLTISLITLWAAAIAQVGFALRGWLAEPRRYRAVMAVFVTALTLLTTGLMLPRLVALIDTFSQTDMHYVLWQWADINVPLDGHILVRENGPLGKTWNRPWGGYDGVKPFDWRFVTAEQLANGDPHEFAASADIAYFAATDHDMATRFHIPGAQHFIEQLTLIKTLTPGPGQTGPTIFFYRVLPAQNQTDATFGEQIRLVGYDLSAAQGTAGGSLVFRPYWRTLRLPDSNYSMFLHLYPAGSTEIAAQYDGAPTTPQRLTLTWDDPNELYIGSDVTLTLPADLPAGTYELVLGLYDFTTGARLQTQDGADHFAIPIEVTEAGV